MRVIIYYIHNLQFYLYNTWYGTILIQWERTRIMNMTVVARPKLVMGC